MYLFFILSLSGFIGILLFFCHCAKYDFEDACNFVYLLFGFCIARWCEYCLLTTEWTFESFGDSTTPFQYSILCVGAAYFLYDIPISLLLKEHFIMTGHHIASFLILAAAVLHTRSGLETVVFLWLGEFNSPFLFFRFHFEKDEKWNKSTLMMVNNVIFLVLFIILRFVLAPFVVYYVVYSAKSAMFIKLGSVLFYVVNFSILYVILREVKNIIISIHNKRRHDIKTIKDKFS